MHVMTYSDARDGLKAAMDRAILDREPVVITRKNRESAVMISLDEYNSIMETHHLTKSPGNARRLRAAIEELDSGAGQERKLSE